jgi:hypothetical protein
MAQANQSGLNVATQAGEGQAGVFHWDHYYYTLNQIHQQQMQQGIEYKKTMDRSALALESAQKGIRPADVPQAQELYSKWKQASLMQMSPKIQKNATDRAKWMKTADDAYAELMSMSENSKQQSKFEYELNLEASKKGFVGYVPANEYADHQKLASQMPIGEIYKHGYNTALPYMLPASTYPKEDVKTLTLGKLLPTGKRYQDVFESDASGKKIKTGQKEMNITRYENSDRPDVVLSRTASVVANIPAVFKEAQRSFKTDLDANGMEWVQGVIADAQKELDARPVNGHTPKLTTDAVGYLQAQNIIASRPKEEEGKFTLDPVYKENLAAKAKQDELNARHVLRMQELGQAHQYKLGEAKYKFGLSQSTIQRNYTVDEIESVLTNPSKTLNAEGGKPPKTYLELGVDAMAHLNAATKGVKGGIEMQPLPVFGESAMKDNEVYLNIIKQTTQKLHSVMEQEDFVALRNTLSDDKVSKDDKFKALANAYNKINAKNDVAARFTPEDLRHVVPVISTESHTGNPTEIVDTKTNKGTGKFNLPESHKIAIYKPGTPEFRNALQYSIDKYGKTLKKGIASTQVVGAIGDMNAQMQAEEDDE